MTAADAGHRTPPVTPPALVGPGVGVARRRRLAAACPAGLAALAQPAGAGRGARAGRLRRRAPRRAGLAACVQRALAQQFPMIIEGGAAVVLVMTTHSPFGEAERAAGRWLPYLRLGAALALTGVAIGVLQLGVTGASLTAASSCWRATSSASPASAC